MTVERAYFNGSKVAGQSSNIFHEVFTTHNGAVTGSNVGLAQSVAALGYHSGGQDNLKGAVCASVPKVAVTNTCNHTQTHVITHITLTSLHNAAANCQGSLKG